MTRKGAQNNYIFIDTNVFLNCIMGSLGRSTILELKNKLDKGEFILILPEVIKTEILVSFEDWKKELLKKVEENLSTKKILGIEEDISDNKKAKRKNKNQDSVSVIDTTIATDRNKLIKSVEKSYNLISRDIKKIFTSNNTIEVKLTNELLLDGMKRSLLKKAPYTRADKTTENAHTKDADCVSFESLLFQLKKEKVDSKDTLKMLISDKDYVSNDNLLQEEVLKDIKKLKIKYCVDNNLCTLLGVRVEGDNKNKGSSALPSLASSNIDIDFSSSNIDNELKNNKL